MDQIGELPATACARRILLAPRDCTEDGAEAQQHHDRGVIAKNRSQGEATHSATLGLLQFGIVLGVSFSIKSRWDELLWGHILTLEIAKDSLGGLLADLVGMLDRIGINLSVTNRLFALLLAVEGDEFDLIGLAGPFERRSSTERRRVVDRKNSGEVRMSL